MIKNTAIHLTPAELNENNPAILLTSSIRVLNLYRGTIKLKKLSFYDKMMRGKMLQVAVNSEI
jgi:hypothetical protein